MSSNNNTLLGPPGLNCISSNNLIPTLHQKNLRVASIPNNVNTIVAPGYNNIADMTNMAQAMASCCMSDDVWLDQSCYFWCKLPKSYSSNRENIARVVGSVGDCLWDNGISTACEIRMVAGAGHLAVNPGSLVRSGLIALATSVIIAMIM